MSDGLQHGAFHFEEGGVVCLRFLLDALEGLAKNKDELEFGTHDAYRAHMMPRKCCRWGAKNDVVASLVPIRDIPATLV